MLKDRIKERRKLLKLSQETLAEKVGVSTTAIQSWEGGSYVPSIENIIALEKALGLKDKALLDEYANDIYPNNEINDDDNSLDEFPYFLFNNKDLQEIEGYHLDSDLKELALLLTIYRPLTFEYQAPEYSKTFIFSPKNTISTSGLPYEYVKECGADKVLKNFNIIKDLYERWNKKGSRNLFYYLEKHPERNFDIKTLDIEDMLIELSSRYYDVGIMIWLLSYLNEDGFVIMEGRKRYSPDELKTKIINKEFDYYDLKSILRATKDQSTLLSYVASMHLLKAALEKGLIEIKTVEDNSDEYIKSKKRYHALLDVYNKTPELYDKKPDFKEEINTYFFLTNKGQEALDWGRKHKDVIAKHINKFNDVSRSDIEDFLSKIN